MPVFSSALQKRITKVEKQNKELEQQLEESIQLNEQMGEQVRCKFAYLKNETMWWIVKAVFWMQLQKTNSAKESLSSKLKESEQQNRSLKAELDKLKQDYELER